MAATTSLPLLRSASGRRDHVNIFIRVEVLARELQGRLLLALAAAERGHHVVLLDKQTAYGLFRPGRRPAVPPGVYHDNSPGNPQGGKTDLHEQLAALGFVVTGQDEEHGLTGDDFLGEMSARFPERAVAAKTAMFAFGPHDAAEIKRMLPAFADRIIMTGSPRVDFWRPDFAPYFDQVPHPLDEDAPPYLLVTVTESPFFSREPDLLSFQGAPRGLPELLERVEGLRSAGHPDVTVDHYQIAVETKVSLESIARDHPDHLVIVRPHPHERPDAWSSVFDPSIENIRIMKDLAISPWIRHAACMITSGSTVAFEGALTGTPLITFVPAGLPITPAASRMGHLAETVDDLVSLASTILRDGNAALDPQRAAAMTRTLDERFTAIDGPLAADRIVDAWESLAPPALLNAPPISRGHFGMDRSARGLARSVKHRIRSVVVPSATRAQVRWSRDEHDLKFPPFDLENMVSIHHRLRDGLGRFERVAIRPIRPRVLYIGPK